MLSLDVREITSIILWEEIKSQLLTKNNPLLVLARLTLERYQLAMVLDQAMVNHQLLPLKNQSAAWVEEPLQKK